MQSNALMAESVDALVSNTSGAIRAGSTPAQGTELGKQIRFASLYIKKSFNLLLIPNKNLILFFVINIY